MKIFPLADFHIESHWQQLREYKRNPDVVVAAGDIHTKTRGPAELRRIFGDRAKIVYVAGNHEYYGTVLDEEDARLREESQKYGIHFLQCDAVEIEGVVFAGCTLWTDFQLFGSNQARRAEKQVGRSLNDYRAIYTAPRQPITTAETLELHKQHKAWLQEQFGIYRGKPLVVVTHHGPSAQCVNPLYRDDLVSAGFGSSLDDLVEQSGAKYWICGHSHIGHHFKIAETEVWLNCVGYDNEQIEGFQPFLELDI